MPIYLANDDRIVGLMFLLTIALRFFTLIEFQVRRQLQAENQAVAGIYAGNPKRQTKRPDGTSKTDRMFKNYFVDADNHAIGSKVI